MRPATTAERRRLRTRRRLKRPVETTRLRLSVFRSAKHIYAQVIDPKKGHTIAEANSKSLGLTGNKTEQAAAVGRAVAERALAAGAKQVVFDRGGYRYHGRVKALADGAREGGLEF
jgi:large subunit ribosomal protein L18